MSPVVEQDLARVVEALKKLGATLVVLFGSQARGTATESSDSDLLVVMPCNPAETFAGRLARVAAEVQPRTPMDLLVYSPAEFERLRVTRRFVRDALAEGRVLHAA